MKILLATLFAFLVALTMQAQQTFVKSFTEPSAGKYSKVVPAADKGWAVFALDSLTLTKFSGCGTVEWARKYRQFGYHFIPNFSDFIRLKDGGYAFLCRVTLNEKSDPIITRLDEQGNVLWSKKIGDDQYNHYTYTLQEDKEGNLVLYGNVSHINNQPTYTMMCKVSGAGNVIWTRFYSHGWIWGASIITSDNGMLSRTGDTFFKTDENGTVEWTYWVSPSSDQSYNAPVEVADGYIFTTISPGTKEVNFHKLDKNGNGLWNGRRHSNVTGYGWLKRLYPTPEGGFTGFFLQGTGTEKRSVLLEFTKDLEVIKQTALLPNQPNTEYVLNSLCFLDNSTPLIAGQVILGGVQISNFIAKGTNDFSFSCDSLPQPFSYVLEPVSQSFTATTSFPYQLFSTDVTPIVNSFETTVQDICSTPFVAEVSLGPDSLLCPGKSITLLPQSFNQFESYMWSTGENTQAITVSEPGNYTVQAFYNCGQSMATDTISISMKQIPQPNLVADTAFCASDVVVLDASLTNATYLWNTGSTEPQLAVTAPGEYSVDITYNGCTNSYKTNIADCEVVEMPNVFTPNADGVNDNFGPKAMRGITEAELKIFNRWGKEIFSTTEVKHHGWDGKTGNEVAPGGIYYYSLRYTSFQNQQREVKGYLELLAD